MDWANRRERFRATLNSGRCIHPASVYDPISARIAEDLGFEAAMLAGSVASLAVLGAPDIVLLTLTEFAGQAYRINRAAHLPLLVDADHGYGNALNVKRTVEELETAGVSALTIEDTVLPRPFGAASTPRLISTEEAVGKLRAVRKLEKGEELVALSGADPLNLVGILTPEARVPALAGNRVLLRDGIAIAAVEGGKLRRLAESELSDDTLHALARRFHWRSLDPHLRSAAPRELRTLERTRDRVMSLPWSQTRR